jgi:hypothetical protein
MSESQALLNFLDYQRASVLAILDGLGNEALRTPVVPSGWTPLGLIEHLGFAERYWFQHVATGSAADIPWSEEPDEDEDEDGPFTTNRPADVVISFYRDQCKRANAMLASTPLSSPPRGKPFAAIADEVTDLRWIVLHMIEETARHAGHLDIAREFIDGQTGLGPR